MEIEKLNENKIKITFDSDYLQDNKISIHSFMSNSLESQALFFTLLEAAEKEVGFDTKNYKISVETLTQTKDCFTIIISRFLEKNKNKNQSRLRTCRKTTNLNNDISLYKFDSFEVFYTFSEYLFEKYLDVFLILKEKNSLYFFKNNYFLVIDKLNLDKKLLFKITSIFSEFSSYIHISENTFQKLKEFGKLLQEKNAIYSCTIKR